MSNKAKVKTDQFRVRPGHPVKLKNCPTRIKALYSSDKDYKNQLHEHVKQLNAAQGLLYAHNRYALLIIFQAMDAGGKDSAIKHVMSGVDPQGCSVVSFKAPSATELQHDFLWRCVRLLPERGHIGIFNRSYYEEALVVRVHPDILAKEHLPEPLLENENFWPDRFESIADFEKHLARNGTRVIKFFLHISKEEQRRRFLSRIDEPDKNWKLDMDDIRERKFWKQYAAAYEECLNATALNHAPWFIIPGDDKKNARLLISKVIIDALAGLPMGSIEPDTKRKRELRKIRKKLTGK